MNDIRKFMNIINESPLGNYDRFGDFDNEGSFDSKERELLKSEKNKPRLQKILTKTPYFINTYFVNLNQKELKKMGIRWLDAASEDYGGEYSAEEIKKLINYDIPNDTKGISFVLLSNINSQHTLSPWIIIHRFTHILEDGYYHSLLSTETHNFFEIFQKYVVKNYKKFLKIATMKSARDNDSILSNTEELVNEFLTQYLVKGEIILKDGNEKEQIILNRMAKNIFHSCIGKIFLGF